MAVTRNPMQGRHAVGGKTARPGSIRSGQGAHVANGVGTGHNQQTASRTAMRPRPPVLANQAETSRDLQDRLRGQATQPFTNKGGAATLPAPTSQLYTARNSKDNVHASGGVSVNPNQKAGGYKATSASIHSGTSLSRDEMAALGYGPKDTMSSGPIISGNPTRNNQRQAGRPGNVNKGTSARENARVRQGPGGF